MSYSVLLSPLFTFLIGDSQERITVPSSLLDRLSPALGALINNGCIGESENRVAHIKNVSVDTFAAVCEYAYTGDYKAYSPSAQDIQGFSDRNIEAEIAACATFGRARFYSAMRYFRTTWILIDRNRTSTKIKLCCHKRKVGALVGLKERQAQWVP